MNPHGTAYLPWRSDGACECLAVLKCPCLSSEVAQAAIVEGVLPHRLADRSQVLATVPCLAMYLGAFH